MTELAALNVRISGDSGDLVAAVNQAEGSLERLGTQAQVTARQSAAAASRAGGLGTVFRRNGFAISNAANQFSDLAVQMQMGTSPARALSQQLPQLTAFMGPLANIIGVAAGVLIGLVGGMLQARGAGASLSTVLEELTARMEAADRSSNGLSDSLQGLVGIGGIYAERAREIAQAQREIAFHDAAAALRETVDAVSDLGQLTEFSVASQHMREMQAAMAESTDPEMLQGFVDEYQQALIEIADGMGLTVEAATSLADSLISLGEAEGPAAQAQAARDAAEAFLAASGSVDAMTAAQREIYASLLETEQASLRLQAIEERRSAAIADTQRELQNEISIQSMILQFGRESVEVERLRAAIAREEYQARLEAMGVTGDQLSSLMAMYTTQENLTREAENTAEAIARITGADLGSFQAQVRALAAELGIAADEAARLLSNIPYAPEGQGAPMSAQPGTLSAMGAFAAPIGTPGGGGGGGSDPFAAELASLQEALLSQEELQIASFERQQETLREALDRRLITQQEYNAMMQDAQAAHSQAMEAIDVYRYGSGLAKTEQFMGDMAAALQGGNEQMLRASRIFAAGEALINAWRAYSQVIADPTLPWFAKIPAALGVLSAGMGAVSAIRSGSKSGGGGGASSAAMSGGGDMSGGGVSRNVAIQLTGGDMFSRSQVMQLINSINEAVEDGAIVRLV